MPTATRKTQAERTAASDRALVRAAVALIAERGYEATTLAAIGERAGYSRGLVTQRFGSKEGLLLAVVDAMMEHWSAHTLRPHLAGKEGVAALQGILGSYLEAVGRGTEGIKALYALLSEASGPLTSMRGHFQQLHRDERQRVADLIRAGQAAGTIRPDADPTAHAVLFLATIRGVTMQWLLDPNGVDMAAALTAYGTTLDTTLGVHP